MYSSYKTANDAYVDALIAGGVSNYHGTRSIILPGYFQQAFSNYSSQQLTLKAMASKNYSFYDFWQLTPSAEAQYSFVRELAYTESGAGSVDMFVDPNNTNLFRLGAGAKLAIPFTTSSMLSIPGLYAMAFVDAVGGAVTTNNQFVDGGPILTNTVQSSRLMLMWGVSYELKISDNVEIVANYDHIIRRGFQGNEAFLNLKYIF